MAACISLIESSGGIFPVGAGRAVPLAWYVGDASYSGGQFVCAAGSYVLLTPAEAAGVPLNIPVLNIDEAGGAALAGAILACWAVAWAFRMFIKTLHVDSPAAMGDSE